MVLEDKPLVRVEGDKVQKQAKLREWLLDIVGCPQCKGGLTSLDDKLHCGRCGIDYASADGIPSLLSKSLSTALSEGHEPVKSFYPQERYDWTRDPKGLEYAYHHYRRWETWKQIETMVKPEDVVLDVGCGTGLITRNFIGRSQSVVAVDMNPWALCQMDGYPYLNKIQGDAESLPIQDSKIDLVIATEVIEHLETPEKAMGEIRRVCRKGARVVGSVPTTHPVWKWRRHLSLTCAGNEPLHNNFDKSAIAGLLPTGGSRLTIKRGCLGLNWIWTLEIL